MKDHYSFIEPDLRLIKKLCLLRKSSYYFCDNSTERRKLTIGGVLTWIEGLFLLSFNGSYSFTLWTKDRLIRALALWSADVLCSRKREVPTRGLLPGLASRASRHRGTDCYCFLSTAPIPSVPFYQYPEDRTRGKTNWDCEKLFQKDG